MSETSLNPSDLNQLFHIYSPNELSQVKRNTSAYANEVYNLTDSNGQSYVMRVLKIQSPDTVNLEAQMQSRLNAAGIRSPQYLEFGDNNFVGEHNGYYFTLSKYIEGSAPTTARPELVRDFGVTLARIHNCLQGLIIPPNKMQWFDPKIAQEDLDAYNGPLKDRLAMLVGKSDELLTLGLPEAVIHGDLWLSNTFAEDDKVTAVFDFETAQNTARIIDLARTHTSMRRATSLPAQQIIDLLSSGYDSTASTPLTQIEKDNFRLAIAYASGVVAAWHAAKGTRYTGTYIEIGEEALGNS